MSRFTEKYDEERGHYKTPFGTKELCGNVIDKLGELEDFEEELGIDFATLISAMKNGIYYKNYNAEYYGWGLINKCDFPFFSMHEIECGLAVVKIKDYGKTWALTKEELEYE